MEIPTKPRKVKKLKNLFTAVPMTEECKAGRLAQQAKMNKINKARTNRKLTRYSVRESRAKLSQSNSVNWWN